MKNFFTLISIENMKLWKRLSTKVMLVMMAIIVVGAVGVYKYYSVANKVPNTTKVSENWKQDLQKGLTAKKVQLSQVEKSTNKIAKTTIGSMKKSIAEDEYRINNNIKPESKMSIWAYVTKFDSSAGFGSIIALFLIIACSSVVAGEFSEGTMKMMISRPYSRAEILTAKLISTLLYGLVLVITTLVLNFLLLGASFGFQGMGAKEMLWTGSSIIYIPAMLKTLIVFGLDFLQVLVYVVIAFAISATCRSRSIATGFSLFLLLVGVSIVQLISVFFSWGKYLPFGLSNFSNFINQGAYINGTSLAFALVLSAIYSVVFGFIGYFTFQKRDI